MHHRKQLKKILNIRYPKKITNKSLCRICQEKPLPYRLAGISKRDRDILANIATRAYFIPNGNKLRGRRKTTVPIVISKNLTLIQNTIRLHKSKRHGRDHRTSTRQEMLDVINITDRESCRRVTD